MAFQLRQEYLISYDVEDNKLRTKLYKELGRYGLRSVQKSVFWGYLTIAELHSVQRFVTSTLKETDCVFITHSNLNGRGNSFFFGHSASDFQDWEDSGVI